MHTEREMTNIHRTLNRGKTVRDLIAELEDMDQDAVVVFRSDYGDYCHTQQALLVDEIEEMSAAQLYMSEGYSRSGLALHTEDVDEDEADEELDAEELAEKKRLTELADEMPRIVVLS